MFYLQKRDETLIEKNFEGNKYFSNESEISVFLKFEKKMSAFSFSPNIPNKIGNGIDVSGKNTLMKTVEDWKWPFAIADEPIDAKVDGKKMFCVRVDKPGAYPNVMIGFTPDETFDSEKQANFSYKDFGGCGIYLFDGNLCYPVKKDHNIIDREISQKAKEIIVILTISNNGTKKEIRFLCDGKESKSSDVSEILSEDRLFPAICLSRCNQQITTIPIDEIKTRTPEIENLIKEYQQQNNKNNNQSGGAVASSSAAILQLQKELDEALQKIAALSSQLQQKDNLLQQEKRQHEAEKKK
jgi:hypothetical protein